MKRELLTHYSHNLNREMHILVYGQGGIPMLAFPTQDGMCDNWESFQMQDTLSEYLESGKLQLFVVDTVDKESWSDNNGDPGHRAWIQEQYYNYIVEEALPLIHSTNGSSQLPIVTGFSLGATHAAILFLRRPELFRGVLACSGCYSTRFFWDGWSNGTLYENSPLDFLPNMPKDHPYISIYNSKPMVFCVGQGQWEGICLTTTKEMIPVLEDRGIHAMVDLWGFDVDHDWPWWKKQILYHLPRFIND